MVALGHFRRAKVASAKVVVRLHAYVSKSGRAIALVVSSYALDNGLVLSGDEVAVSWLSRPLRQPTHVVGL